MSIVSFPLFLTIAILSFFGSEESNPPLPVFEDGPSQKRVVQSEVTTLNVPVSEIDDGAVYYIRNVGYSNRYWDVYYANYTNGNHVQVCPCNLTTAQKFIVKKQFDHLGQATYRIAPLGSYDKVLRLDNQTNASVVLGDELYSQYELFADKFIFDYLGSNQFAIRTGSASFGQYLSPATGNDGAHVVRKVVSSVSNAEKWEFLKTDYLGLDVCNKAYVNGTNESRFVIAAPATGNFIIETQNYSNYAIDTFLTLRTNEGDNFLASNDDGGAGTNARISFYMTSGQHYAVYLRGYSSGTVGYTYLVFRPAKSVYLSGGYKYESQEDFASELNDCKDDLLDLGCFGRVYANRPKSHLLDTDSTNKVKMNHEYFAFSGHGSPVNAAVQTFNGTDSELLLWNDLPTLNECQAIVWNCCHGARQYYKVGNSGEKTSMAYQSIANGAQYAIGWDGEIYNLVSRHFTPAFFNGMFNNNNDVSAAVAYAISESKNQEFWWWTFARPFASPNEDFENVIVYKYGDTINSPTGLNRGSLPTAQNQLDDYLPLVTIIEGFVTSSRSKFSLKNKIMNQINTNLSLITREGEYVTKFHACVNNVNYYMATVTNPRELSVRHYDLLTGERIHSRNFETIMNNGMAEAASYYE